MQERSKGRCVQDPGLVLFIAMWLARKVVHVGRMPGAGPTLGRGVPAIKAACNQGCRNHVQVRERPLIAYSLTC